ncbi:PQQ-binding-like beta-propeller repeat protein [Dactylosporangium sp. NPDC048998]|uniref:outer membrane protein assembly factor BamB family protein n=1 Tax=Dactylosporangium sp. NPDC048998 TaxID=3363976 RepID=UPI003714A7DE
MTDAMIELDVSTPWEPPAPDRRGRRRWFALAAVLVVAGSLHSAAAARHGLAPLYQADPNVLTIDAAADRLYLVRQDAGGEAAQAIEAVAPRDGRVLWRRPMEHSESLFVAEGVVLVQDQGAGTGGGYTGRLVAIDGASGTVRWERPLSRRAGMIEPGGPAGVGGPGGRLVLVRDLAWPDEPQGFDTSYGPDDLSVALPLLPHHERYLALELDTGRVVWSVETSPGSVSSLDPTGFSDVTGLSVLDASGVLRVHDLRTGAVAATYRLDWSGAVALHRDGVPGQELVYRAGGRGVDVYDRASGRLLWRWPGDPATGYHGLYPCLQGRYCVSGTDGTDVLNPATGARLWRAERYNAARDGAPGTLMLDAEDGADGRADDVAAFSGDTGALRWHLTGWHLAYSYADRLTRHGAIVWRPVNDLAAVVGLLDPADGTVKVIGRAENFYGTPQCAATDDRIACVAVGRLFVWARP